MGISFIIKNNLTVDTFSTRGILSDNMFLDLTDRQIKLLEAIIKEYLETSEPVGSVTITKKYPINASAATVRNEMAELLDRGLLEMMHASSGRVPTPNAYKLFLQTMVFEEELSVLQEVAIKQRLWAKRYEFEKMTRQAVLSLSEITHELGILITDDGYITHSGAVNLLDATEFWDIETMKAALFLLDRHADLFEIFRKNSYGGKEIMTAIGEDIGIENLRSTAFVYAPYACGTRTGYVGIFGPLRMRYETVIPAVRYTRNLIQELGENW
mgnify:CR=1 FL=1